MGQQKADRQGLGAEAIREVTHGDGHESGCQGRNREGQPNLGGRGAMLSQIALPQIEPQTVTQRKHERPEHKHTISPAKPVQHYHSNRVELKL